MARKVIMMASNDQKYESDSKRDEEKPSSIADSILAMINQMIQGGKKEIETQTQVSTRIKEKVIRTRESTNSRIKDRINMINQLKIQKEKEMYCSVVKDGAYSKITEENLFSKSCIDPTGDDLKIASGAFGYWIDMYAGKYDQNEIKEECVVEYDTCKEDGMPYIYEAYCDSKTGLPAQMQPAQMLDCREIFGDENYVCIKGACVLKTCGDGLKNKLGEECDDGNTINGDGCDKECKDEPLLPDLTIGTINENAASEACVNFFEFEICNEGNAEVKDNFKIAVYANDKNSIFTYEAEEQPLLPGECVLVKNPTKTNILKFGGLGETHKVTIKVDVSDDIQEELETLDEEPINEGVVEIGDEDNNEKSQTIYFGDNYYYTPNDFTEENICNTWCFDTDDGKNYLKSGDINWIYINQAYNDKDQCSKYGDFDNQVFLYEQYCISPIYKLNNGLYVYPQGEKVVDCTLLDSKCKDGKCVPIKNNYLNCKDMEGMLSMFTYGEVDYTSIDGEKILLKDKCLNEETLLEYYCQNDELAESDDLSCFYENAVCQDGECVKTDKTNEFEDSDPDNDPFVYGTGLFIKLNGETQEYNDDCAWKGYEVIQYSAGKNNYPQANNVDCTQYKNENGAAMCANGVCTYPDPTLMICEEGEDNGLNYYEYSTTHSINAYSLENYNGDFCIEGTTQLIEFYCNENELKMTEPYDCSLEDMACYNGKCVVVDESLKSCEIIEKKDKNVIHYTNEFGDEEQDTEFACSETNEMSNIEAFDWEKESNYLAQFYCDGNEPAYTITDCTTDGKKCYDGQCMAEDQSLVKCEDIAMPNVEVAVAVSETSTEPQSEPQETPENEEEQDKEQDNKNPFVKGITLYTNSFGEEDGYNDYCENEELLSESYCENNEQKETLINCVDFGMKCYNSKCVMPDENLKFCEIQNEGEEWQIVEYTNEFGYHGYFSNLCIDENDIDDLSNVNWWNLEGDILVDYKCDGKNLAYDIVNCKEQGKVCYNKQCLVKDESLKSCTNDPNEASPDDPFIEGINVYTNEFGFEEQSGDNCEGNVFSTEFPLYETYCEGNELTGKLIDCNDYGMKCNDWKDICQMPVTEMKCEDTDDGEAPNVPGKVTFTSEFGDSESEYDECNNKDYKNVWELFCIEIMTPDGAKIIPEDKTMVCEEGKTCREFCDADGNYIGGACADPNDQTNICTSESTAPMEKQPIEEPASSSGGGGSGFG
ncbi:hypothetical protein J4434_08020 [Candidatus Woesearchaeota archaeon]|nr:hypothetical protein [Candidatus Woesearchaeota archaeon]